jgi:PASTA domain
MPINTKSMIVGFALAKNEGLPQDEAMKLGVASGFLPPTPVSLVTISVLAKRRAEEIAPSEPSRVTSTTVSVPDVVGATPPAAADTLEKVNLVPQLAFDPGLRVTGQDPKATPEGGEGVPEGTAVKLTVAASSTP